MRLDGQPPIDMFDAVLLLELGLFDRRPQLFRDDLPLVLHFLGLTQDLLLSTADLIAAFDFLQRLQLSH